MLRQPQHRHRALRRNVVRCARGADVAEGEAGAEDAAWLTAMVSPRPWPWPARSLLPVRKRLGPSARSSSGKPGPWSRTRMTRPSTETSIGGLPCRAALARRLNRTRSRRRGSVVTSDSCTTCTTASGSFAITRRLTKSPSMRSCSSARSDAPSSRATSSTSSTSVRIAFARSRTSSVGRPGGGVRPRSAGPSPGCAARARCPP